MMEPNGKSLTSREAEVFGLIGQGFSSHEITNVLGISYDTLRKHRGSILRKLGVNSSAALVAAAAKASSDPATGASLDLTPAGAP